MNYVFVYTLSLKTHSCQKCGMYLFILYDNVIVICLTDHRLFMYIHSFPF